MKLSRKLLKIYLYIVVIICVAMFGLRGNQLYNFGKVKHATAIGGFPLQISLIGSVLSTCKCIPPFCTGCWGSNFLCFAAVSPCYTYTGVSGVVAGGDFGAVLLKTPSLGTLGLTAGGPLMCGGASPVMMNVCGSLSSVPVPAP